MGSFYTLCSVTKQTIVDGQNLVIQFMLPTRTPENGEGTLVKAFIESTKTQGLDEALKIWARATENWGDEMGHKGLFVSNDGAIADYIPFGPAIRGKYNDYGNVVPLDDEETQKRVKLMERIFCGIPFQSLMGVATDDRWYRYGVKGKGGKPDKYWQLDGVDRDLPDFIMEICKKLTVTYMHAPVYDTLINPNFSPEGKNDSYETKWKLENLEEVRKGIKRIVEIGKGDRDDDEFSTNLLGELYKSHIYILTKMDPNYSIPLVASCIREGDEFEWLEETISLVYSMGSMCIKLERSQYGSQHFNWEGWKTITESLQSSIEETKKEYGYYDDDEDI